MLSYPTQIERLTADVSGLLARHEGSARATDYSRYRDDPVGFIREVLRWNPWDKQVEIADAVRDHVQVTVRGANGVGKDALAARLALWWVYARNGLVLITGPTEKQVRSVLMRTEVKDAFDSAPDLPGELGDETLRIPDRIACGIIAFTSNNVSRITGYHAPALMAIVTEAQGVEPHTWEGLFACATGDESRILVLGNPLEPAGKFYDACRSSHWVSIKIAAADHPNVQQKRQVIPGAITQAGIDRMAAEYGTDSGYFRARVLAEFPEEASDGLVLRAWLDQAVQTWERLARDLGTRRADHVVAADIARLGADRTVLAWRQAWRVNELMTLRRSDTMETVKSIRTALEERLIVAGPPLDNRRVLPGSSFIDEPPPLPRNGRLVIDEIGVGAGVLDRCRELGMSVVGFNSGRTPEHEPERYLNLRAENYFVLRHCLERGLLGLPNDPTLFEELLAITWRTTGQGKVQIESKDDIRTRLGRSTDKADAVSMVCQGLVVPGHRRARTSYFPWPVA